MSLLPVIPSLPLVISLYVKAALCFMNIYSLLICFLKWAIQFYSHSFDCLKTYSLFEMKYEGYFLVLTWVAHSHASKKLIISTYLSS